MESIGKIIGTHGVKGLVVLEHQLTGELQQNSWDALLIELLPESRIPFFIESVKKQSNTSLLIKLEEINSPEDAKEILQKQVYLSPNAEPLESTLTTQADNYIGYTLFDKERELGIIDNILNPRTNPLFILFEHGENETLIPANKELIISVDSDKKQVIADLPEGLI